MVTYALAIRVVECLELDNIGVTNDAHDLKLTVLPRFSRCMSQTWYSVDEP
jgi:hypothetical protein